jgi:general secretion pathway protein I
MLRSGKARPAIGTGRGAESRGDTMNRTPRGFTLLEVMVAVAIMAMVLVTLMGVKNGSTRDVMLADHITTATLLAKRMMTETLLTGTLAPNEDEGEFPEEEFKGYTWKKTISLVPIEVRLLEVRLAVLWKEGERQEMVELVSYE